VTAPMGPARRAARTVRRTVVGSSTIGVRVGVTTVTHYGVRG
jgi:hypothetical protein